MLVAPNNDLWCISAAVGRRHPTGMMISLEQMRAVVRVGEGRSARRRLSPLANDREHEITNGKKETFLPHVYEAMAMESARKVLLQVYSIAPLSVLGLQRAKEVSSKQG